MNAAERDQGVARGDPDEEEHVEDRADQDVRLATPPARDRVVGDRADRRLDDHGDHGAADRDEEQRPSRVLLVDEAGELEPAGQDRVQAGEDRRQPEPVERDPDAARGSAGGRSGGHRAADPRWLDPSRRVPPRREPARRAGSGAAPILRARNGVSAGIQRDRGPHPDQPAIGGGRRHEPEQRPIERVDPGRGDRRSGRAGRRTPGSRRCRRSGAGAPSARQDGQVGLAAEPIVERGQEMGDRLVRLPGVLEPACPDLGVGPTVDPALPPERLAQALVVAQVAVVAEREAARPGRRTAGCRRGSGSTAATAGGGGRGPRSSPSAPTRSRPGSSRKARTSRYDASRPSGPIHAAPQPKPAIPNRSRRSANGHSSSSRNGSSARAMKCSHMFGGC